MPPAATPRPSHWLKTGMVHFKCKAGHVKAARAIRMQLDVSSVEQQSDVHLPSAGDKETGQEQQRD